MKISIQELISESVNFIKKYKIVILFGFLIGLINGGGGNFGSNFGTSGLERLSEEETIEQFETFFTLPIIIISILVGLLLILAFWYVGRSSLLSIINAVNFDGSQMSNKIKFGYLWGYSQKYILRFLLLDIFFILIWIVFVGVIFIPMIFLIVINPAILILVCCLLVGLIPIGLIMGSFVTILKDIAIRLIVLTDCGIIDSLKNSYSIIRSNLVDSIMAVLIGRFAVGVISAAIVIPVTLLLFTLMLPIFFALVEMNNIALLFVSAIFIGLVVMTIIGAVQAIFVTFSEVYMTKFTIAILKHNSTA